jgi:hypothetical protein
LGNGDSETGGEGEGEWWLLRLGVLALLSVIDGGDGARGLEDSSSMILGLLGFLCVCRVNEGLVMGMVALEHDWDDAKDQGLVFVPGLWWALLACGLVLGKGASVPVRTELRVDRPGLGSNCDAGSSSSMGARKTGGNDPSSSDML